MMSHTGKVHRLLFPSLEWRMDSTKIFLTFDDGPHPEATPAVLKVLRTNGIKATFFVSGNAAEKYPSLVREVDSEGHSIGIHAFTHTRTLAFSKKKTMHEILRTAEEIQRAAALAARLFRPPFGYFSWNTIDAARSLNYRLIMWTTMSGDFRNNWSDEEVVATALTRLSGGSILVFHDNELTKSRISIILSDTIKKIQDRGFSFDKIS